jgi:hypothetical protein
MRIARTLAAFLVVVATALAATAAERTYDPRRAGHPLRIAAYALHPIGVILDWLIFRPAWHIGGVEPIRTLVGRDLEPQDDAVDPLELIPPPAPAEPEPEP